MLPRLVYTTIVVIVLGGCHWGPRAHLLDAANTPAGVNVRIRVFDRGPVREAELYAVDSSGVFVRDDRLRHITWTYMREFRVVRFGSEYSLYEGRVPLPELRRRFALMSRFPQGLEGDLLANVLRLLEQSAVEYVPGAPSALDSLATETARLTARYADRRQAMADGYRRIGTDFPGMGEHWLHSGSLIAGRIEAARPTLLAYANLSGQATLVGAGYVITTSANASTPVVPGWPTHWHEHSGLLADESGTRVGAPAGDAKSNSTTRVWVLHIWSALANPAGAYSADNWALPFARAGLSAPAHVDADIGRAFSLAVGGRQYLEAVLRDAQLAHAQNAADVLAALDAAQAHAEKVKTRAQVAGALDVADVETLRNTWRTLADQLRTLCGPGVNAIFAPAHGH